MAIPIIRRISRIPKAARIYHRYEDATIQRAHHIPSPEFGEDPLEARAVSKSEFPQGTLPERILYKALVEMIGRENFVYQHQEGGGRNVLGGYVLDFIVTLTRPGIAIEVHGSYWHRDQDQFRDLERALTLARMGYEYYEITEQDIYQSDEYLRQILDGIIGRYIVQRRK